MKTGVLVTQVVDFQALDGFDILWFDEEGLLVNPCQGLDGIDHNRSGGSKEVEVLPVTIWPVGSSRASAGLPCVLSLLTGNKSDPYDPGECPGHSSGVQSFDSRSSNPFRLKLDQCLVIAADDFLLGGFDGGLVIHNGKADHIDPHVCW